MKFGVDIYSPGSAGTRQGAGPIYAAQNGRVKTRMARAGEISWDMSGMDPRASLATLKRVAKLWGQLADGQAPITLGAGVIENLDLAPQKSGDADLRVSGMDLAEELAAVSVGNLRLVNESGLISPVKVWFYDGAGGYTDLTQLYDNNTGTQTGCTFGAGQYLYIGSDAPFNVLAWQGFGYNGSTPAAVIADTYTAGGGWANQSVSDGTSVGGRTWGQDGRQTWAVANSEQNPVNGVSAYWVRLSTDTPITVSWREVDVAMVDQPTRLGPSLIMALAPTGWSLDLVRGVATTLVGVIGQYRGQSVLAALIQLAEETGEQFWIDSTTRQVVWLGRTWTSSGIRAVRSGDSVRMEANPHVCLIDSLRVVQDAVPIINRIYPHGGGNADAELDLSLSTWNPPAGFVINRNAGYIEHTASITAYGLHEKHLSYKSIAPIANTDEAKKLAADTLAIACWAQLDQVRAPITSYALSIVGLKEMVYPGETIRVIYQGWADVLDGAGHLTGRQKMIDIDLDLYILETDVSIDTDTVALTVASYPAWPKSASEWQAQEMEQAEFARLHPQAGMCYAPVGPYTRRISPAHSDHITCRVGPEVLACVRAMLGVRSGPLISSVSGSSGAAGGGTTATSSSGGSSTQTSSSGGGATVTSGASSQSTSGAGSNHHHNQEFSNQAGGTPLAVVAVSGSEYAVIANGASGHFTNVNESSHTHGMDHTHGVTVADHTHNVDTPAHTHDVTLPDHSHAITMTYGIHADTVYPEDISITIDGVDRTAALGGPWGSTSTAFEGEFDITQYLTGAPGGLRQRHRIEFSCAAGQGEIEAEVSLLLSVQAITVVT